MNSTVSAIHKTASLTVAGCSMILPGTIPSFHHSIPEAINGTGGWNGSLRSFQPLAERWTAAYSPIHKAASLTVPSHSMILPGTIPETPISREWSRRLELPQGVIPTAGRTPTGGFVNSAVSE